MKRLLVVFCILLPLFLLLLSYKIVLGVTSLTPAQQDVMTYLDDKGSLPEEYNEAESSHFADVKGVMRHVEIVFYMLLLGVTLMITYYRKDTMKLQKMFRYGGITTIISILFFIFMTFFFFDSLFTQFHHLFFPQGNWQFPLDSMILQTFPFSFFSEITAKITSFAFILGIVFIAVSFLMKNDTSSTRH